ncbi:MAG: adenine phosphoribosyltransferase [Alphaproteobacteria bacterium]|nr:adenine phosphoribosyltransferase [Alphaproteobacteria bacterium]
MNLKEHIRGIPDFPKPGILFYDIGTLLADGPAWKETISRMTRIIEQKKPEVLIGVESRGFLVAAPVAAALGIGMIMARKKGKLPGATESHSYTLEYGSDTLEMQSGILPPNTKAVLVDDLLATGGTSGAVIELAKKMKINVISAAVIIELTFLNGRQNLKIPIDSLLTYDT